jgi:hypothetical protein
MPSARFASPESLVQTLALDNDAALRSPCPRDHLDQCWSTAGEELVAPAELVEEVTGDLARLEAKGVEVLGVRVVIVCAKRLNAAIDRGLSRFHVDLHSMERLVSELAGELGGGVRATCGKVGGFDRYGDAFGRFLLSTPIVEGRARSAYAVPGIGEVAFVRDAEERDLLVAMASLVGKWVRDLLMRRIVRFHRANVPDLPDASGYHDPVTTRFIDATALTRRKAKLPDECFVRRALEA